MFCDCCSLFFVFFFFKQKTAYEMRISDWSSDVCSSDLRYPGDRVAADAGGGDDHLCRSQDLGGDGVAPWPQRRRAAGAAPELRRRREGVPQGNDHPIAGGKRAVSAPPNRPLTRGAWIMSGGPVQGRRGPSHKPRRAAP